MSRWFGPDPDHRALSLERAGPSWGRTQGSGAASLGRSGLQAGGGDHVQVQTTLVSSGPHPPECSSPDGPEKAMVTSLPGKATPALGTFLTFLSGSSGPAGAGQRNLSGRKPSSGGAQQSPGVFLRSCQTYALAQCPVTQVQMLPALAPGQPCWSHLSMAVVPRVCLSLFIFSWNLL